MIEYIVAGALAALVVSAVRGGELLLPRLRDGRIQMGFVGRLVVGMASAVIVDGNVERAFLGALAIVAAATGATLVERRTVRSMDGVVGGADRDERLAMLRRKLRVAEQNLATYGPGEASIHMQIVVEELRAEIARLEGE